MMDKINVFLIISSICLLLTLIYYSISFKKLTTIHIKTQDTMLKNRYKIISTVLTIFAILLIAFGMMISETIASIYGMFFITASFPVIAIAIILFLQTIDWKHKA